ncbi:relaxase/mobilization nuclease domain-containing protein [Leeuwenhoekiella aequorea]|uniref:Relaxase/mobilization nuclease-like protein n=1 Tax=Leeuwenhoekiella aequorea TaxID=283736 RepID=A0A4Q0PBV4_9FLAO|nr:relaxase/mobilization nuclease domain-containing protein [Leeuwenhoekiella aequorea]RXG24303.1 relaxase/mobilization nuclease-like protein [Leeuwenhoekiella aequorea]
MVGLGRAISHLRASLEYADNDKKNAELVHKELLSAIKTKDITREFNMIHELNHNCLNNVFSFVISPVPEDGARLKTEDWNEIAHRFKSELGLNDNQSVGYVHNDRKHRHLHLYVNRIDFSGKALTSSYIGYKSMKAAEKVAIRLGLQTIDDVKTKKKTATKEIRKELLNIHKKVISKKAIINIKTYELEMKQNGILAIAILDQFGNLRGFRFIHKGYDFKASEIHKTMAKNQLLKDLEINKNKNNVTKTSSRSASRRV